MTRMRSNLLIKTYQGLFCSAILLKHGIDNSCLASLSSPSLANFQHELSTTTKSHNVTLLLPTVAPKVNQHRSHEEQRYILSVSDAATTTGTDNIRKRNYIRSHVFWQFDQIVHRTPPHHITVTYFLHLGVHNSIPLCPTLNVDECVIADPHRLWALQVCAIGDPAPYSSLRISFMLACLLHLSSSSSWRHLLV